MKYLKTILFTFILIIILSLITTILYYFNITSTSANNVLRIISIIIIFIFSGIYIGKNSSKKGWLEGLKIAGMLIFISLVITLAFKYSFNIKQIIYYLIMSVTVVLGSMIGINFGKQKK